MKLHPKNLFFFLLVCFGSNVLFSQQKFEKEYRIGQTEVPEKAVEIIKDWNFNKKIKWYAEESQDGKTFEAKVCYQKRNISVEFSENGELIDAEKTVKFRDLSEEIQQKIKSSLSKRFRKYRIKKIQIQYTGNQKVIYEALFQSKYKEKTVINYELIVKGKKEKSYQNFEILITSKGEIEKELLIKSTDFTNLEF
jgi:hypothetical protein